MFGDEIKRQRRRYGENGGEKEKGGMKEYSKRVQERERERT